MTASLLCHVRDDATRVIAAIALTPRARSRGVIVTAIPKVRRELEQLGPEGKRGSRAAVGSDGGDLSQSDVNRGDSGLSQ